MNGLKRLITLLLCLSLTVGLLPGTALAAALEEDTDLPVQTEPSEAVQEQGDEGQVSPEPSQTTEETSQLPTEDPAQTPVQEEPPAPQEPKQPETEAPSEEPDAEEPDAEEPDAEEPVEPETEDPAEEITPEVIEEVVTQSPALAGEPSQETATEQQTVTRLKLQNRKLTLTYDDRITPDTISKGYSVLAIETVSVYSRQVAKGRVTATKDKAVLRRESGSNQLVACGIGVANVYLVPSVRLQEVKKLLSAGAVSLKGTASQTVQEDAVVTEIPCICCRVTVKPAKLTLFFLAGQSNMEGLCNGGYRRQDSVACTPGTVYSTYIPASGSVKLISGTGLSELTQSSNWSKSVAAYLPASMTATASLSGGKLVYPLNALTSQGGGKTGMDSALGYEWNRLTGEKVWLVNAGWTNTSINKWVSGGVCCQRATAAFTSAVQVLQAEVSAGHYTAGRRILFWLQGEADRGMDASSYASSFRSVCTYFQKKCAVQYTGIISVRAARWQDGYMGYGDLIPTGPRIAQYGIAADASDGRIFMVSNANENWISDQKVSSWYAAAYPGGKLSYPMHTGGRSTLPTLETQVHPGIHFTQLGHNENGFTAARGLYDILNSKAVPKSAYWISAGGKTGSNLVQSGTQGKAVLVVNPVTAAKQVTWKTSGGMSFSSNAGVVSIKKNSMGTLRCSSGSKTLNTLTAAMCAAPSGLKAVNANGGVQVSWNAVRNGTNYRVFYRIGTGTWQKAGDTKKTTLLVKNLASGKQYSFTVRCINASASAYTSSYNTAGVSVTYVAAPVLRSAKTGKGTATLTWNPSPGAAKYRVYYKKTKDSNWKAAGTTEKSEFTLNNLAKSRYVFTVRCVSADGKSFTSGYDGTGKSFYISTGA